MAERRAISSEAEPQAVRRADRRRSSRIEVAATTLKPIHCLLETEPIVQVLWPAEVWCKRCRAWHSARF